MAHRLQEIEKYRIFVKPPLSSIPLHLQDMPFRVCSRFSFYNDRGLLNLAEAYQDDIKLVMRCGTSPTGTAFPAFFLKYTNFDDSHDDADFLCSLTLDELIELYRFGLHNFTDKVCEMYMSRLEELSGNS